MWQTTNHVTYYYYISGMRSEPVPYDKSYYVCVLLYYCKFKNTFTQGHVLRHFVCRYKLCYFFFKCLRPTTCLLFSPTSCTSFHDFRICSCFDWILKCVKIFQRKSYYRSIIRLLFCGIGPYEIRSFFQLVNNCVLHTCALTNR